VYDMLIEELKALPPDLREVWLLRYVERKKLVDVARALGISENQVYVRIRRLKRVLKRKLGPVLMQLFLWLSLNVPDKVKGIILPVLGKVFNLGPDHHQQTH
jgi:hypothetical protein